MTKKDLTRHGMVLLIQAPMQHPACRPRKAEVVAAALAAAAKKLTVFDAGIDFFKNILTNSNILPDLARRTPSMQPQAAEDSPGIRRRDMETVSDTHRPAWLDLSSSWERLQTAAWTRPDTMISDVKALDAALSRASAAFSPCRLGREGFAHPGLNSVEDMMVFRDDPQANPFWRYAFQIWQPFAESAAPDMAVLSMTAPGQIPPGATLALAWRRRWPDIPLLTIGVEDLTDETREKLFFEKPSGFAADEVRGLAAHLRTLDTQDPDDVSPDGSTPKPTGRPVQHRASIERPLAADQIPDFARGAAADGRKLIIWKSGNEDVDAVARQLHAVARLGIWNHLVLVGESHADLEQFARANANVVHSWCWQESALSRFSDPGCRYPAAAPAYGDTVPLPGKPLWMVLHDPVYLEAALERIELKSLLRMRLGDDGRSVFEVGQDLRYHFVSPKDLPAGYLQEIVRMIAAGGSVQTRFVKHNLERAHLVAYVEERGVIIGNSCLKHPRDEYIEAVSRQSGVDLHQFLERGYTSVRPEYRGLGIGTALLAGLTERAGSYKIFSVIAEGNIATQKMAIRNRTRRVATFYSRRAHKQVGVWIPEGMLPKGLELPEQPDV